MNLLSLTGSQLMSFNWQIKKDARLDVPSIDCVQWSHGIGQALPGQTWNHEHWSVQWIFWDTMTYSVDSTGETATSVCQTTRSVSFTAKIGKTTFLHHLQRKINDWKQQVPECNESENEVMLVHSVVHFYTLNSTQDAMVSFTINKSSSSLCTHNHIRQAV